MADVWAQQWCGRAGMMKTMDGQLLQEDIAFEPDCIEPCEQTAQSSCGGGLPARLNHALLLLQEKWVLFLVHRLLHHGPSGFNEVGRESRAGRHGAGVNNTTLSQRLALLEREGIVTRTVVSTFPPRTTYELTEKGRALGTVLNSIEAWSEQWEQGDD